MRSYILKILTIIIMLLITFSAIKITTQSNNHPRHLNKIEVYLNNIGETTFNAGFNNIQKQNTITKLGIALLTLTMILSYIYIAITHKKIAEKLHYVHPNWFWIPILNLIALFQMGDIPKFKFSVKNSWIILVLFISLLPNTNLAADSVGIVVFFLVFFIIKAYMNIAEKLKFPRWTALLTLIHPLNLIIYGIWAWGNQNTLDNLF